MTITDRYNAQRNTISKYKTANSAFDSYVIAKAKGKSRYILNISEYNTVLDNITKDILSSLDQAMKSDNFRFTV